MTATAAETVPMGRLLDALGRELEMVGTLVDRIQDTLSPALTPVVLADKGVMANLQELDRLAQTTRALASVAARLAEAVGSGVHVDPATILDTVPLAALAARLGATLPATGPVPPEAPEDDGFTMPSVLWA